MKDVSRRKIPEFSGWCPTVRLRAKGRWPLLNWASKRAIKLLSHPDKLLRSKIRIHTHIYFRSDISKIALKLENSNFLLILRIYWRIRQKFSNSRFFADTST